MDLLRVQDLTKSFGGLRAVDSASFTVEAGTITALIGPNGAGKTTAFNIINGVMAPDAGRIEFDGHDITRWKPHRITWAGMSRTFQVTRTLPELTVLENLALAAPARGFRALARSSSKGGDRQRAAELLEFVGLTHLTHSKAFDLSYGQRKLLEFASVLMSDPRLVLLDEPAGGINPALIDQISDRIVQLKSEGVSFLLVEHNMELVMNLADSVVVMAQGQVLMQGTPEQVQADERVVSAYLGNA